MKKIILVLFLLAVLAPATHALLLKSEKNSYVKGEELSFTGLCDQGVNLITGETEGKEIFSQQVVCQDGGFSFSYKTSFLDPSGSWNVTLVGQSEESTVPVRVELNDDSAYYRLTFLSPAERTFKRSQSVFLSVQLTDSGEPVDGAQVVFYDVFARRITLRNSGNGIYDLNYLVPFDAQIKEWGLVVTATNEDRVLGTKGGERKIDSTIIPANFTFSVVEPTQQTYEQSDTIPFKVAITYPNGSPLKEDNVQEAVLIVKDQNFALEANSEGEFIYSYNPQFSGNQEIIIFAKDTQANQGQQKIPLVITCSFTCFLKNWGLIILVFVLVVGVVLRLFYKRITMGMQLSQLKTEKEKTIQLIKDLQGEYFGRGVMPSSSYKKNLTSYKSRLIELDEQIKQLSSRLEEEK